MSNVSWRMLKNKDLVQWLPAISITPNANAPVSFSDRDRLVRLLQPRLICAVTALNFLIHTENLDMKQSYTNTIYEDICQWVGRYWHLPDKCLCSGRLFALSDSPGQHSSRPSVFWCEIGFGLLLQHDPFYRLLLTLSVQRLEVYPGRPHKSVVLTLWVREIIPYEVKSFIVHANTLCQAQRSPSAWLEANMLVNLRKDMTSIHLAATLAEANVVYYYNTHNHWCCLCWRWLGWMMCQFVTEQRMQVSCGNCETI